MLIATVHESLCLDYANTRSWRGSEQPTERLQEMADLLGWIERSAGAAPRAVRPIASWSREHPRKAAKLFVEAIAVREAIYRAFSTLADGPPVRDADFAVLRDTIAATPARRALVRADGHYAWRVDELRPSVAQLLAPVLWSAGDLLINAERLRIRRCANDKCLWLFLDESKSGTRRWCDMASCGNRAKASRHYAKVKQG